MSSPRQYNPTRGSSCEPRHDDTEFVVDGVVGFLLAVEKFLVGQYVGAVVLLQVGLLGEIDE
jgi:hypothetical protein